MSASSPSSPPPLATPLARDRWLGALLVAALLAAYWPALPGGFLWDDDGHVTKPELRSLAGLARIWFEPGATQQYYPVLHSAFWLEHRLWGDDALGYHLVNVLLHATAALLLVALLRQLCGDGRVAEGHERRRRAGVEWLAAFLFALHPVHVESVAWISEQKNTLSAVFYLAAALAYVRFDDSRERDRPRSHRCYALAFALFTLALLTKTVTATLPAALLVLLWWRRGALAWRRDVAPLAPWFAAGIAAGLTTAWFERTLIGAEGADFALSFAQRLLLAGRAVWFYLGKLVWPASLTFTYPRWALDATSVAPWLFPLAALFLLALLWRLRGRARAPLAGCLFFAGTLFPVLGFFNVYPFIYSFVADHFQYLASLGVLVPVAAVATTRFNRLPWFPVASAALVVALALATWRQSADYADAPTLYRATLARNPGSWMAHNNLGIELFRAGHLDAAIAHYRESLRLRPATAHAHNNLANALQSAGRPADALPHFQAALRLKPDRPEFHNGLGTAFLALGRLDAAAAQFNSALQLDPANAEACNNLGTVLQANGRARDAAAFFQRALRLRPDFPEAHSNLAFTLGTLGQTTDAIAHAAQALRLRPRYARAQHHWALALARGGRAAEAVPHFEAALALQLDSPELRNSLGDALRDSGRFSDAIESYEHALRLRPGFFEAHNNLGTALHVAGRTADAIAHFAEAVRLRPDAAEVHYNLALVLRSAGRATEARAHADTARRLRPDLPALPD